VALTAPTYGVALDCGPGLLIKLQIGVIFRRGLFMEYIHETIDSDALLGIFNLPLSLRNRKVEVIVKPAEAKTSVSAADQDPAGKSAFGCLHRFANPAKIAGEHGAWKRAAITKYAKN
jgi:hypothetical protein